MVREIKDKVESADKTKQKFQWLNWLKLYFSSNYRKNIANC